MESGLLGLQGMGQGELGKCCEWGSDTRRGWSSVTLSKIPYSNNSQIIDLLFTTPGVPYGGESW